MSFIIICIIMCLIIKYAYSMKVLEKDNFVDEKNREELISKIILEYSNIIDYNDSTYFEIKQMMRKEYDETGTINIQKYISNKNVDYKKKMSQKNIIPKEVNLNKNKVVSTENITSDYPKKVITTETITSDYQKYDNEIQKLKQQIYNREKSISTKEKIERKQNYYNEDNNYSNDSDDPIKEKQSFLSKIFRVKNETEE